jgi:hypothetical protein
VAEFAALHAFEKFNLVDILLFPAEQASVLIVADVPAFFAGDDGLLSAAPRLMSHLVALEAHLLRAIETFMSVFSAQNATF